MKFMKLFILGAIIAALGLCSTVTAAPVLIAEFDDYDATGGNDVIYVGADDHGWGDVIGAEYWFGVRGAEVYVDNDVLIIDIYTRYLNNFNQYQTELGDLFISTDEWTPFGSSPYVEDDASNGEDWEYALVMDDHTGGTTSGVASLYSVNPAGIVLSYAPSGYIWRTGQEVQYSGTGDPAAVGTWEFLNLGDPDSDDFIRFSIGFGDWSFGVEDMAFHYTMSCANDVIEGGFDIPSNTVPEPSTLIFLGSGLLLLGGYIRKKRS